MSGARRAGRFGGIALLVRRSLRQHAFSTVVTVASVALATGLTMALFAIQAQSEAAFTGGATAFDAVLGARGSQLQLVLNTVFHLETSPGNLPWSTYQAIRADPRVAEAIPYAVGDNYRGYRIVGTVAELFTRGEASRGLRFRMATGGRVFDSSSREAVVGSLVAERLGLHAGSTFHPFHGVVFDESARHDELYTVVGVLEPTHTPSDRVLWIPIEGVFRMAGHVLRGAGTEYQPREGAPIPDEAKEVSAVMLKLRSPQAGIALDQTINRQGKVATLAWPIGRVMSELLDKVGWMSRVLLAVAQLVVIVAAASILASLYNTMSARRRDFAILRALGAGRCTVLAAIVLESTAIAALGAVMGLLVHAAIVGAASALLRDRVGVVLDVMHVTAPVLATPVVVALLGAGAGIVPALRAYATDVASNLAPAA
ncbi:MAG: ABC transporter permease [Deltaproteobacteria bacterium]|nr:ABC transporter permease [Deltaproteobacteria bacterium]